MIRADHEKDLDEGAGSGLGSDGRTPATDEGQSKPLRDVEFWLHTPDNVLRMSCAADQSRWG